MKALHSLRASMPLIAQLGFAVLLTGFVADMVFHLSGASEVEASSAGLVAHLVTVVGMVLVLVGVVQVAVTTVRRTRTKGGNDAARRSTTAAR